MIGNSHYPDANAPLTQPVNDARALTAALRHEGFDVDVIEDASHDDMTRAVARLKSKVRSDSVVMLFFGGYGIQVGRESYMIPVDATIWKEADVRREGVSVEAVLDAVKDFGACAKLVVLDASRRNPYERRFRAFSHGLAPVTVPDNALILTSASPGAVADDSAVKIRCWSPNCSPISTRPSPSRRRRRKRSSTRPALRSRVPRAAPRCPRSLPR